MDFPVRDPSPSQDHLVRDPPLCCVVVWCVGAVCVQKFRGCAQNLGAPPTPISPPPDPLLRPKFRSFFSLSRHCFHSFSLSGRSSRGILVFEASVPTVPVWAHGLSCETPVASAKCQEQFYN